MRGSGWGCDRTGDGHTNKMKRRDFTSTTLSLLGILSWKLGRSVKWDGAKEECPGDAEASAMLVRPYRAPWDAELKALGVGA